MVQALSLPVQPYEEVAAKGGGEREGSAERVLSEMLMAEESAPQRGQCLPLRQPLRSTESLVLFH